MRSIITWISRILIGGLFIFSGVIKANDPLGFSYKLDEYFVEFGKSIALFQWDFMMGATVYFSIIVCVLEIFVGAVLLLGLWRRITTTLLLLMIIFFGFLTFYSAYFEVVQDCGCFGDFITLTPWESFFKNLIMFAFILWLFFNKQYINPLFSYLQTQRLAFTILAVAVLFPVYTYNFLPVLDFRPYEIGNDIKELMEIPEGAPKAKYEIKYTYENKESGKKQEFTVNNLPDSLDNWKFIERKQKQIREAYEPPIHDFSIEGFDGYNATEDFLKQTGYRIVVVQHDLTKTNTNAQEDLNKLYQKINEETDMGFWTLTASGKPTVNKYKKKHNVNYEYYITDRTTLKTIIRANPGVLLMKDNVIKAKWSDLNIPSFNSIQKYTKEKQS